MSTVLSFALPSTIVSVQAHPYGTGYSNAVVPIEATLTAGVGTMTVTATASNWCWIFRYVGIDDNPARACSVSEANGGTVTFASLTDVNPVDFAALPAALPAAWQTSVDQAEANAAAAVATANTALASSGVTSVASRSGAVTLTKTDVGLSAIDNTADTAKPVSTAQQTALDGLTINVKTRGVKGDGVTDDTAAINAIFAAIPVNQIDGTTAGVKVYFPTGIYLCNTVTSGTVLALTGKSGVTVEGSGIGTIIRTTTAVANDLFLVKDCNYFRLDNMRIEVTGTAAIVQRGLHVTCSSPGSMRNPVLSRLLVRSVASSYRKVYDFGATLSSAVIWSAQAAFSSGDVGGSIMLNFSQGPFVSTISSVATASGTLAADITSSQTTITLNSALSGTPASGFTIQVQDERMFVSAGGTTTTLTVQRARGNAILHPGATHAAGTAVTTYSATMADINTIATISNSVMAGRIQAPGQSVLYTGIAIGVDNPGAPDMDYTDADLRDVTLSKCHRAGVQIGNGTPANSLCHRAFTFVAGECGIGVYMYGAVLSVHGGNMGTNVVDFKSILPATQDVTIENVRSEGPALFWDCTGAVTDGPPVILKSINVASLNAEDGMVIRHNVSLPITLESVTLNHLTAGNSVSVVASGTASFPCSLTAINVSSNGGNSNLFSVGLPTCVRTIISSPRILSGGYQQNTVIGTLLDNKLALNGGLVRARTTVADAAYTVLASDGLVVYTSLTAARVATLPAQGSTVPAGQEFTIKDESGSCSGSNTITITPPAGTIDGASNVVLNTAYARTTVYTNGSNWFTR